MKYPREAFILEVGPRDGLQNEKKQVSTKDKLKFIELIIQANLKRIEATSFVSPKWVPQLADAKELYPKLPQKDDVRFSALVPNLRGLADAIAAGVNEISVGVAASETFNKKNMNKGTKKAFKESQNVIAKAKKQKVFCRGYVITSFFCPYEGKMSPETAVEIAKRLFDFGCEEIGFGDTIGKATPMDVEALLDRVLSFFPKEKIAMHFHNTCGCAQANILKSLEYGIVMFDASTGGLGGCPYAPGAGGNVATEDVLYMLEGMGIRTGVSMEGVLKARTFIEGVLGHSLPSRLGKIRSATIDVDR